MMRRMMRRSVVSLLFLVAVASVAKAQISAGASELSLPIGFLSTKGIDNNMHVTFGGEYSYSFRPKLAVLGEYTYQPLGQANGYKADSQLFGFGARYFFHPSKRLIPYVVGGGGYYRSANILVGTATHTLNKGGYLGGGGGLALYAGNNWGFRPEFRYQYEGFAGSGSGANVAQGTIAVFYQFPGSK